MIDPYHVNTMDEDERWAMVEAAWSVGVAGRKPRPIPSFIRAHRTGPVDKRAAREQRRTIVSAWLKDFEARRPAENLDQPERLRAGSAAYSLAHQRMHRARGPASEQECAFSSGRWPGMECHGYLDWANIRNRYRDVNDYACMCQLHHANFDAAREELGL